MDLQNEAIELQKVFRKNYKTYWEETQAIKTHLESRFKELNFKLKDNVITIENERNISDGIANITDIG